MALREWSDEELEDAAERLRVGERPSTHLRRSAERLALLAVLDELERRGLQPRIGGTG